jgi:tRNA(fMet)-specific endonuclease VapC
LILDSGVVIAAERRGLGDLEFLEQLKAIYGETPIGLSVVTIAELTHGAYRALDQARKMRRLAFIDRLCQELAIYPVKVEIARMVGRIEGEQADSASRSHLKTPPSASLPHSWVTESSRTMKSTSRWFPVCGL